MSDDSPTEPPPRLPLPSRLYTGEPEPDVLSKIYNLLTSPNGELSLIRRDVNALTNATNNRQRADSQNWDLLKHEVRGVRETAQRVEGKLDRLNERVDTLEARAGRFDAITEDLIVRIAELEKSKPPPSL